MSGKLSHQLVSPWSFWLDSVEHILNHPEVSLAPHRLWQSILPGWIFAQNVTVNPQNSSSPETEGAIQSRVSYGKQLGKVIDALNVLITVGNDPAKPADRDALDELQKLYLEVNSIKEQMSNPLAGKIANDLLELQQNDPTAYLKLILSLIETNSNICKKVQGVTAQNQTATDVTFEH